MQNHSNSTRVPLHYCFARVPPAELIAIRSNKFKNKGEKSASKLCLSFPRESALIRRFPILSHCVYCATQLSRLFRSSRTSRSWLLLLGLIFPATIRRRLSSAKENQRTYVYANFGFLVGAPTSTFNCSTLQAVCQSVSRWDSRRKASFTLTFPRGQQ